MKSAFDGQLDKAEYEMRPARERAISNAFYTQRSFLFSIKAKVKIAPAILIAIEPVRYLEC